MNEPWSAIGTLILAPVFLALACGGKMATDEAGDRAVGTLPSAAGGSSMSPTDTGDVTAATTAGPGLGGAGGTGPSSGATGVGGFVGSAGSAPVGVDDPGVQGCTRSSIHVASGMPHGNSDFDLGFSCESDAMGGTGPIGYFVAGHPSELVITGCARPGLASPGIRFVVSDVSGPNAYSTNAISFVDPMLNNWNYQGALPSNQLGWTTTITSLGPVGGSISGTYIGRLTSNEDVAHLMGKFTVCRAPDRQGH